MESELFALLQHTTKTLTFTLSWLFHPVCHLCFSWSFLLPLLINCVESFFSDLCVCVCSSTCVWTQWGMFQSGLSQSKQRPRSALCDELSPSESHLQSAKPDGGHARGALRRRTHAQRKRMRGKEEVADREIWMRDHHFAHLLLFFNPNRWEQREIAESNSAITLVENEKMKWPKTPPPPSILHIFLPFFSLCSLMSRLPPDVRLGAVQKAPSVSMRGK